MTTLQAKKSLDDMNLYEMVMELRDMHNPFTNKDHHSLTEIAKVAGAPHGWTLHILKGPRKNNSRSEPYMRLIRTYLKERRAEEVYRTERDAHTPRPPEQSSPQRVIPVQTMKEFGEIRRLDTHREATPNGTGTIERRGDKTVQTVQNGARLVTRVPSPISPISSAPSAKPQESHKMPFMERFEATKKHLWSATEEFDALVSEAPPLFKAGVSALRDKLLILLQEMEA
jgi:hypothetical protein